MDIKSPYTIGKYKININALETIALPPIEGALNSSKIIIIDEIGPMELFSNRFKDIVLGALDSPNRFIATIKLKGSGFIEKIKLRKDVIIFSIDLDNRDIVVRDILKQINIID